MSEYVPTGDPSRHGWKKCAVCGTWNRSENVVETTESSALVGLGSEKKLVNICKDTAWCIARIRKEK